MHVIEELEKKTIRGAACLLFALLAASPVVFAETADQRRDGAAEERQERPQDKRHKVQEGTREQQTPQVRQQELQKQLKERQRQERQGQQPARPEPRGGGGAAPVSDGQRRPTRQAPPAGALTSAPGRLAPAPVDQQPGRAPAGGPGAAAGGPRRGNPQAPVYTLPSGRRPGPGENALLPREHGESVLGQVNSARAKLGGVNGRPVPSGRVTTRADGALTVDAANGLKYQLRPDGTLASLHSRGRSASFRPDGKLQSLHAGPLRIEHAAHKERRIVGTRPDKSILVSTGRDRGYLQRSVVVNNVRYVQRTYVSNKVSYSRVYAPYSYNGLELQLYLPRAYYPPTYYGWAANPWSAPRRYNWGVYGEPWYAYYGGYFTPAPVYPSAASWLVDYIMADTLRSAYQELDPGDPPERPELEGLPRAEAPITPQVRRLLAREVRVQLTQERMAAVDPGRAAEIGTLANLLRDPNRVFVVSSPLDVATPSGWECALTAGDVLRLSAAPGAGEQVADLTVVGSKRSDCPVRAVVTVALADLQEMNNAWRDRLYGGLDLLRKGGASGALPPPPGEALLPPTAGGPVLPTPADDNVLAQLQSQQNDADRAERQFLDSAFSEEPPAPGQGAN